MIMSHDIAQNQFFEYWSMRCVDRRYFIQRRKNYSLIKNLKYGRSCYPFSR